MTTLQLPQRAGSRPTTTTQIPHSQVDQQPETRALSDSIIDEASQWADVVQQESGISVEGARALALTDNVANDSSDRFMVGREFCHLHAQGDYSFHAVLSVDLAKAAESAGWAEPHFLVRTGQLPPTNVMIYAPRDNAERDIVRDLVRASYDNAIT